VSEAATARERARGAADSLPGEAHDLWRLAARGEAIALLDAQRGVSLTYAALHARAAALAARLRLDAAAVPAQESDDCSPTPALQTATPSRSQVAVHGAARPADVARPRGLVFVECAIDVGSIVAYLGAQLAGHVVLLLDRGTAAALVEHLRALYRPDFVVSAGPDELGLELEVERCEAERARPLHPSLALLLSTSGTTGSPKLVRLSRDNLLANARSIASYLQLDHHERAISSLPFHYSYGLSVLHSHLYVGASMVVSAASVMRPELWQAMREHDCTSFAGVPYAYQIMRRVGFEKQELPRLRTLTQAGGKLPDNLTAYYRALMAARGGRFVTMYGATEATARMSYLPPERAADKPGSIGIAIPDGALRVVDPVTGVALEQPFTTGELVYSGPNVMLGYASSADELALGDTQHGELRTGDLGHRDEDGFFYVTGRLKRFAKVYGLRINLDEVEARLRQHGAAAVVSDDERLTLFCEFGEAREHEALRAELAEIYKLNVNTFRFVRVEALPLLASGKVDYESLQQRSR
jgi:long-chain acyl-CoA synthetase